MHKPFSLLLLALLAGRAQAQVVTSDAVDDQIWTDFTYTYPLDKERKWNLSLGTILRSGDNASRFYDRRLNPTILRRLSRVWTVGAGFQYRLINPTDTSATHENRYVISAIASVPLSKRLSLINRNFLERRDNRETPDATVYRNRTQLNFAPRPGARTQPFVAAEYFYDFKLGELARARYALGVTKRFSPRLAADLFVLRQIEGGNGRPGDQRALGLNVRISR